MGHHMAPSVAMMETDVLVTTWDLLPPDFVARLPAYVQRTNANNDQALRDFALTCRAFRDAVRMHVKKVATMVDVNIAKLCARMVDERDSTAVLCALLGSSDYEDVRTCAKQDPQHVFYLWLRDVANRIANLKWKVQTSRGYSCEMKPENCVLAGTACEFKIELPVPDTLVPQTPGWATLFETCMISPSPGMKGQTQRDPPPHTALVIGPLSYACRTVEHGTVYADEREHWMQAHRVGLYVESENPWRKRENEDKYDALPVRVYLHALDVCQLAIDTSVARPLCQGGYELPRILQDFCTHDDHERTGVRIFLNAYTERGEFVSCAELSLHWTAPGEARAVYHTLVLTDDDPAVKQANRCIDCVLNESFIDITAMAIGGKWDPAASFGRARVEVWKGTESIEEAINQYGFSFYTSELDERDIGIDDLEVDRYSLHFIPDYEAADTREEASTTSVTWDNVAEALDNNRLEFFVVRIPTLDLEDSVISDFRIALGARFTVDPESVTARVLRLM